MVHSWWMNDAVTQCGRMRDLGITLPKRPLRRVDLTVETGGLPPSLIAAIEAEGGLWSAGDAYTSLLRPLQRLRYARLELTDLESLEPLRDHPALRMVAFAMAQELDLSVLASSRGLKAVRRGKRFERPAPWPELGELSADDPLRVEWSRAMAE